MKNVSAFSNTAQNRGGNLADSQISITIYAIRCIAILSVITAHLNVIDNSDLLSSIITHIWAIIARFGVPCFLITGGYYYHREKNDTISFWRKKIFSVLIPWIIASFFTYTMHSVLHKSWSIIGYLKWFIGSNSLYYYMTVYVIMLVLFKFVTKTPHLVMMCPAIIKL